MVEFGRFGILADGRPIRLGGRACDVLTALIEASGAVVSKDAPSSRVCQRQDRRSEPAVGTILPPRRAKALASTAS
jgi:DNA-binding winged helix-turn-helix (wHTH) protein